MWRFFLILPILLLQPVTSLAQQPPDTAQDVQLTVDFNRPDGTINRALFSLQGFMQAYVEPNPMVMESFKLLNPQGTQTRLEIWPHLMEPENDNDDPQAMNWDALRPQKMIRMIDDFDSFMHVVEDELGMEPLALITYNNAEWMKSNNPEDPVASHDEWAEFAAAVVETFNGREEQNYEPRLRFAQLWNEPNMPHFYGGSMESYFELFNTTSRRLHANYPGVITGGPNISHAWHTQPKEWMEGFIEKSGPHADFIVFHHYGPQGESPDVIFTDIRERAEKFRAIPGKEDGRVMITETDAWYDGWPKIQFIMERQFGFLRLRDYLLGVHHFCVMAYNESGNYTFGTIDEQGGVIEGVFWPYWMFRSLIGDEVHATAVTENQSGASEIEYIASRHINADGTFLGTAVVWNKSAESQNVTARLYFPESAQQRVLAVSRLSNEFKGIAEVAVVEPHTTHLQKPVALQPGEAVALTIQDSGKRHFTFSDLNNQEKPWISAKNSANELQLGGTFEVEAEVLNTTLQPVSGVLKLGGMPEDWIVNNVGEHHPVKLSFGERASARFAVTAKSLPRKNTAGVYAWLDTGSGETAADKLPHSIPASIEIIDPVVVHLLPAPVHAIPGEQTTIEIQLESQYQKPLPVEISFTLPQGVMALADTETIVLQPNERLRYPISFLLPESISHGEHRGSVQIAYAGETRSLSASIIVAEPIIKLKAAQPIDLSEDYNFDALAYFKNREDYTKEMGMFIYPADYTPLGRLITIYGVPYALPGEEEQQNNALALAGQEITLGAGKFTHASFLGFGYDGFHKTKMTINYADGASANVDTEIPQWCTPPPVGARVAFTAPHRYTPGGVSDPPCEWFAWEIPLDGTRQVRSITLPNEKAAHIFAITLLRQ